MVKGVVSQIKTLKSTGDITLAIDVPKEFLLRCVPLHFETVYLLTEEELAATQGYKKKNDFTDDQEGD